MRFGVRPDPYCGSADATTSTRHRRKSKLQFYYVHTSIPGVHSRASVKYRPILDKIDGTNDSEKPAMIDHMMSRAVFLSGMTLLVSPSGLGKMLPSTVWDRRKK